MNKNTMNWTDNKVENTNMQQRSNPMANEQFYMDTMPVRTMPNIGTYGDNVQARQTHWHSGRPERAAKETDSCRCICQIRTASRCHRPQGATIS